jgi:hypothetical protein
MTERMGRQDSRFFVSSHHDGERPGHGSTTAADRVDHVDAFGGESLVDLQRTRR